VQSSPPRNADEHVAVALSGGGAAHERPPSYPDGHAWCFGRSLRALTCRPAECEAAQIDVASIGAACLQPTSCNRSPNHLASMQMPYRDPASEWRSARERHGQMTSCRACGAMISTDASTCPRCRTILSRTAVAPAGLVALVAIAVLYVLSQRYW
jgi:ribosomal protein L40E